MALLGVVMATLANPYPGHSASAEDVFLLAEEYRRAAKVLLDLGRTGEPLSRAPYRLTAIHAIELYLNALLLIEGLDAPRVRGLQHDLAARAKLALQSGLALRSRTAAHLEAMAKGREYLVSRYGTDQASTLSQINRLQATLEEIGDKVGKKLERNTG